MSRLLQIDDGARALADIAPDRDVERLGAEAVIDAYDEEIRGRPGKERLLAQGRVSRFGQDETTRMQRFVIEVFNTDQGVGQCPGRADLDALRPGMFVEVEIQGRRMENIFELPRYMVQADDTVFVAAGDELKIKPVRVIRRLGETVFIESGISASDLIIKTPLAGVAGGEKIRIKK